MGKTVLLVVYGCHGAGKSSLAKNIIMLDGDNFTEHSNEFGKYTVSENENIIAVGKYSIKCGGADSLKGTEYYYKMLNFLINTYKNKFIIIEGIFLSALFKRPLQEFLKLKYDYGVEVVQIFLYADAITSYYRVFSRNNRKPKISNIKSKVNSVKKNIIRFKELNEFPYLVIDTINKTKEDVFNEAKPFIERFWKPEKP